MVLGLGLRVHRAVNGRAADSERGGLRTSVGPPIHRAAQSTVNQYWSELMTSPPARVESF